MSDENLERAERMDERESAARERALRARERADHAETPEQQKLHEDAADRQDGAADSHARHARLERDIIDNR